MQYLTWIGSVVYITKKLHLDMLIVLFFTLKVATIALYTSKHPALSFSIELSLPIQKFSPESVNRNSIPVYDESLY